MARKAEKLEEAVAILRKNIIAGYYGAAGQLPARTVLEKELGIPKPTMSQVILQLQGEGLIAHAGNRRLQALMPRKRIPLVDTSFAMFLQIQGFEPVTEYLAKPERLGMDKELADMFGVEPGSLYIARIRRDGTKQMWYRTTSKYYLASLIDDESLAKMQRDERHDVILDIKRQAGISANFLTEDTIGRLPTPEEQEQLSIARNSPVLEIVRTSYEREGGRVLWLNKIVVVASLFVLHSEVRGERLWQGGEAKK